MIYGHQDAGLVDVPLILRSVALTDPQSVDNIVKFGAAIETMIGSGELKTEEASLKVMGPGK